MGDRFGIRCRRTTAAALVIGAAVALGVTPAAGQTSGTSTWHADAHASYLTVNATLGADSLVDVDLFPTAAEADNAGGATHSSNSHARAANLDATSLGTIDLSGILTEAHRDAAPNQAADDKTLLAVPAGPLADVEVSNGYAGAQWLGDDVCPSPGSPYALAATDLAQAELLDVEPTLGSPVATVNNLSGGLFAARSWVERTSASPVGIRSIAQAQTLNTTLFAGTDAETVVNLVGTFELTAEATGTTTETTVTWPVVEITLPGGSTVGPIMANELDPVIVPISGELDGLLGAATLGSITIDAGFIEYDNEAAGTDAEIAGAALAIDVDITVGTVPTVDAEIRLAPLEARAHVTGEIVCTVETTTSTTTTPLPSISPTSEVEAARGTLPETGDGNTAVFAAAAILLVGGAWFLVSRQHVLAYVERQGLGTPDR